MSTKKINAGDTLTVGDLTDAHLGAVIEVGPTDGGITSRFRLDRIECYGTSQVKMLTTEGGAKHADLGERVRVIAPPPVVQPDEPTELGQCIWIDEPRELLGVVADPEDMLPIRGVNGDWMDWVAVLRNAGRRQIVVSDPPRWPDETPVVPERIEAGEWPDDDTHLRAWEWHSVDDRFGNDHTVRWNDQESQWECLLCDTAWRRGGQRKYAWTRGERVK